MRDRFLRYVLLAGLCATPAIADAAGDLSAAIDQRGDIKDALESNQAWRSAMQSDKAVPMPFMGTVIFISKKQYRDWLTTALLTGKIDSRVAAQLARQVGDLKRDALQLLDGEDQALRTRMAETEAKIRDLRAKMDRPASPPPNAGGACQGFEGTWDTTFGRIALHGGSGGYVYAGIESRIAGAISGNTLSGRYFQPNYPDKRYEEGPVEFTLSADGKDFTGTWKAKDNSGGGSWNGHCVGG